MQPRFAISANLEAAHLQIRDYNALCFLNKMIAASRELDFVFAQDANQR
jgi:hypothetical protein